MAEILTDDEVEEIRNRANVGMTSDILALISSHRALVAERDRTNTACLTYHAVLCERHKNDSLGWKEGDGTSLFECPACRIFRVEERIRTLEAACELVLRSLEAETKRQCGYCETGTWPLDLSGAFHIFNQEGDRYAGQRLLCAAFNLQQILRRLRKALKVEASFTE